MKHIFILSFLFAALSSQTGMAQTVNWGRPDIPGLITMEKVGYEKIINPLTMQLIDTPNRPMIFYLNALDWAPVKGGSGIPKSMIKDIEVILPGISANKEYNPPLINNGTLLQSHSPLTYHICRSASHN